MGSTITISKAKNFSFKKLSFLYLVFILFIFFSSPGMYVMQYSGVAVTQDLLNEKLLNDLSGFNSVNPMELALKTSTMKAASEIEALEKEYLDFANQTGVSGDRLRENNFAEKKIRKGELGPKVKAILTGYIESYSTVGIKDVKSEFDMPEDFVGSKFPVIDFYFKETPNGVLPSVFEHFRTVMLYNTLLVLKKKDLEMPKFEILTLDNSDFIQKMKRNLILGEKLDVVIRPQKKGILPTVKINGGLVESKPINNNGDYRLVYTPKQAGNYSLEVKIGDSRLLSSFNVESPAFRFIHETSNLRAEVGGKFTITLDSNFVPKGERAQFVSQTAAVERKGMVLTVVPEKEGKFEIQMVENGKVIDRAVFFASLPRPPKVSLMDIYGNPVQLSKANKLESDNVFWQVIDFDVAIVSENGNVKKFHSATRFLRNEIRELENNAQKNTTFIFENIRLTSQKGGITMMASPIIMVK